MCGRAVGGDRQAVALCAAGPLGLRALPSPRCGAARAGCESGGPGQVSASVSYLLTPIGAASEATCATPAAPPRMSEAFFDSIQAALSADGKLGPKVGGSIQFVLTGGHGGDSTWVIDCKQSKVSRGAGKADCTVTLSVENFMALATGKLQGMQAFMAGKMKVKGNMMLAQKFGALAGPGAKSKL